MQKFGAFVPAEYRVSHVLGVTSDDRAVFELGEPLSRYSKYPPEYWSYSPSRNQWTNLGSPGVRPDAACFAGDRLVVLNAKFLNKGQVFDDHPGRLTGSDGGSTDDGWVQPALVSLGLTQGGSWHQSEPNLDAKFSHGIDLSCLRDDALLFGATDRTNLRRYDFATGQWSTPASPSPGTPGTDSSRVWTGTELVLVPRPGSFVLPGQAYHPTTTTWRALEGLPPATTNTVWGDTAIIGCDERDNRV